MLRLAKTDLQPMVQQRIIRMHQDGQMLRKLSRAEIRAVYAELEQTRDAISEVLDAVDGKT